MEVAPAHAMLQGRQYTGFTTFTSDVYITSLSTYSTTLVTSPYTIFPLTSIFTPPSSCLAHTYTVAPDAAISGNAVAQGYVWDYVVPGTTATQAFRPECYPSSYGGGPVETYATLSGGSVIRSEYFPTEGYSTYYSPGICPSGYATAIQSTADPETVVTCCPSGFTAGSVDCHRTAANVVVVNGTSTYTTRVSSEVVSSVAIRFQATDSAVLALATATATGSGTVTTGPSTSTPTSAGVSSTGTASPDPGLSTGAQAGIGVGVSLGVLLIAGALAVFLLRRRKQQRSIKAADGPSMREVDQNATRYTPQLQ